MDMVSFKVAESYAERAGRALAIAHALSKGLGEAKRHIASKAESFGYDRADLCILEEIECLLRTVSSLEGA